MAGKKGRSGAPGEPRPAGPGRLPQSARLALGQAVAVKAGDGPPLLGRVTAITRGSPRTVTIEDGDGRRVELFV